jgi:hypothetical protein
MIQDQEMPKNNPLESASLPSREGGNPEIQTSSSPPLPKKRFPQDPGLKEFLERDRSTSMPSVQEFEPRIVRYNSLPIFHKDFSISSEIITFVKSLQENNVKILALDSQCIYSGLSKMHSSLNNEEKRKIENNVSLQKQLLKELVIECALNSIKIAFITYVPLFEDPISDSAITCRKIAENKRNIYEYFVKNFDTFDESYKLKKPFLGTFPYFLKSVDPEYTSNNIRKAIANALKSKPGREEVNEEEPTIFFWSIYLKNLVDVTAKIVPVPPYKICTNELITSEKFSFIADIAFMKKLSLELFALSEGHNTRESAPTTAKPNTSCTNIEATEVAPQQKRSVIL